MYIEIDEQSSVPIYMQLANQMIHGIANGDLAPYESLPSGRMLAKDLNINMHTVNKAYHYLEAKAFIQVLPKSGAIIHPNARRSASTKEIKDLKERMQPLIDEAKCLQIDEEQLFRLIKGE